MIVILQGLFLQLLGFSVVKGFILDSNNNEGTVAVANRQCVTLAEFHSTIKQLQREVFEMKQNISDIREIGIIIYVLFSTLFYPFPSYFTVWPHVRCAVTPLSLVRRLKCTQT